MVLQYPAVSIVIATYERLSHLKRCLERVRANVSITHELIVVAGGSDGSAEWLKTQPGVHAIVEKKRQGATRAYNEGFRAARGKYVMWLNDDSYPLPGAIEAAVEMIERPSLGNVGMIAFYHNEDRERNKLDTIEYQGEKYSIYNVRGIPYANFGLLPRELLARLGYLDERYYFCAWDPDLSLKVQREAGLQVVGCRQALIHHDEVHDERKLGDSAAADEDNRKLFAKWQLPEKFSYGDPAPAYRAMVRQMALAES